MAFTEMEKIREEERLVYLFVWGDDENQEFIFGLLKVEIPIRFPAGNVKLATGCMNSDSRGECVAGNVHLGNTSI